MENEQKINASAYGINESTAEKIRTDILPSVALGDVAVGKSIKLKILSAEPEMVKYNQKKIDPITKQEVEIEIETPIFKVHNFSTGLDETLWLSSNSLKMEMFKLSKQTNGNLTGKDILIYVEEYKNEIYGMCRGYRAQIQTESQE